MPRTLAHALTEVILFRKIGYDQSSAICGFNITWPGAFRTEAVVAPVFPF
jgi:hypothetical protein